VATTRGVDAIVGGVQHGHRAIRQQHAGGFVRGAVNAAILEVAHLRQIAAEGESAATPAILVAATLVVVVPVVSIVILLAFGIADLS
jgi:hypothetical protein